MDVRRTFFAALIWLAACTGSADRLAAVHADIVSDYPGVTHVDAAAMADLDDVLLVDIREADEYAVSRLPGAVRIAPGATEADLLEAIGDLRGRAVVAYCSVGRRSSIFARDHADALLAAGAASVSNLEGGVFRWHGDRRALENADGATDAVHPYDEVWKRYVVRKDKASYAPEASRP